MTKNDFLHKIIEMLKTINIGNRIEKDKEREEKQRFGLIERRCHRLKAPLREETVKCPRESIL